MKQWFTPAMGHNSRVHHRPYGTFPDGYVTPPTETAGLLESMPGIGPERFCAAVNGYVEGRHGVNEMFALIGARS